MNFPTNTNSSENNRKPPALATAAMLLVSAIAFAGFAAITPAFATEDKKYHDYDDDGGSTEQLIEQLSAEIVAAEGNVSDVSQDTAQIAEQVASGEGDTAQEILQASAEVVASGGDVSDVEQSTAQIASQDAGEDEEE